MLLSRNFCEKNGGMAVEFRNFHTVRAQCGLEINRNYFNFRRKFREINGFTKLLNKDLI